MFRFLKIFYSASLDKSITFCKESPNLYILIHVFLTFCNLHSPPLRQILLYLLLYLKVMYAITVTAVNSKTPP